MKMKIIRLEVGNLGTNCYIVACEKTKKAAVIDPGGNAEEILATIHRESLIVEYIINTHGHMDHILANHQIKEATGAKILIHEQDAKMLKSAHYNLSVYVGHAITSVDADQLLKDGDIITFGSVELKVLHTPGHSPGGICLFAEHDDILFCGDTIFCESVGRTDLVGGSYSQIIRSVKEKIMVLKDEVKLLPGHGPDSSVGWERRMNPFIQ